MNTKSTIEESIDEAFQALKQQRDEIKVKVHLANMEVQDEWGKLEEQWDHVVSKKERLKKDLEPTVDDAHIAWMLLKDEIVAGYHAITSKL